MAKLNVADTSGKNRSHSPGHVTSVIPRRTSTLEPANMERGRFPKAVDIASDSIGWKVAGKRRKASKRSQETSLDDEVEARRPHTSARESFPFKESGSSMTTPDRSGNCVLGLHKKLLSDQISTDTFDSPDRNSSLSSSTHTKPLSTQTKPIPIPLDLPSFHPTLTRKNTYSSLPPSPSSPSFGSDGPASGTFDALSARLGTSISLRSLLDRAGAPDGVPLTDLDTQRALERDKHEGGRRHEEDEGDEGSVDEIDPDEDGQGGTLAGLSRHREDARLEEQAGYFPHQLLGRPLPVGRSRTWSSSQNMDENFAMHINGHSEQTKRDGVEQRTMRREGIDVPHQAPEVSQIRQGVSLVALPVTPVPSHHTRAGLPAIGVISQSYHSRLQLPSNGIEMLRTRSSSAIGPSGSASVSRPLRGRTHSHAHAHTSHPSRPFRREASGIGSHPGTGSRQTSFRGANTPREGAVLPSVGGNHISRVGGLDRTAREEERTSGGMGFRSLWSTLKMEISLNEGETGENFAIDGKWDRIANFLAIPVAVEKNIWFGSMLCLDSFIFQFTILPIRSTFAILAILSDSISKRRMRTPSLAHLRSLLRMSLVIIPTGILLLTTDASRMYHLVRGQDTIKLYVILGAVEVADKLCCAFGQDVLDTLFARETLDPALWPSSGPVDSGFPESPGLSKARIKKRERARPVFFWLLAVGYVHVHSLVLFYQLICLNVAINSYDNALLTLLVSNQFTEIKGSVFKKFEKDNLFQILCADIVERYQLSLMLSVIALRNLIEMTGSDLAFLPKSFMRGKGPLEAILSPALVVILSEMVTDWLKHAFVTKFNHIRASVYERYTDVLCKDILLAGGTREAGVTTQRRRRSLFVDQSPLVTRRLGLATLPLCCLVIRVGFQGLGMLIGHNAHDQDTQLHNGNGGSEATVLASQTLRWVGMILVLLIGWLLILSLKFILGANLLAYAAQRERGMEEREKHDSVNDFGRLPISESKAEKAYAKEVQAYLSNTADNMAKARPVAAHPTVLLDEMDDKKPTKPDKAKNRLEDIERWTMVKRIF